MLYGVCCGNADAVEAAQAAGFDFVEFTVANRLRPTQDDGEFEDGERDSPAAALPCPAVNCFLPGSLPLFGPDFNEKKLFAYVDRVFSRARQVGVETIVFGSGKARQLPDGMRPEAGRRRLLEFCLELAPRAAANHLTIVLEPLNHSECNILNSVRECAELTAAVDHPAIRLLADSYHMARDRDSIDDLIEFAPWLAHTHVATGEHRRPPAAEACPTLESFVRALRQADYRGRLSIEASLQEPRRELESALALLKSLSQ